MFVTIKVVSFTHSATKLMQTHTIKVFEVEDLVFEFPKKM